MKAQVAGNNFASGEVSPKVRARYELPLFQHALERNDNFISELQGPDRFRNGFRYAMHTRRNKVAAGVRFQFSNVQSYAIEFTNGFMRFFKDNGIITESAKTITGITAATPPVVTSVAHGYVDGDEVYITGVKGMTQVNGKFFIVDTLTADTFALHDQDDVSVVGAGYTAYSSAGTAARIYEIASPYLEADNLYLLRVAQNGDELTVVHPNYDIRKITRSAHTSWAIARFSRTADPFLDKKVITGISAANPAVVTAVGHGYSTGAKVIIEEVVGMTQVNSRWYTITKIDANNFSLNSVDSSAYTAWSSAGFASDMTLLPSSVTFHQGRSCYDGIAGNPLAFKLSRSPANTGATRYDDFTNGVDADHAVEFTINAEDESASLWIKSNTKFLLIGGFTGVYKITGNTDDEPITPNSVNVTRISAIGTSNVNPITYDISTIYAESQNLVVRSLDYDLLFQSFKSNDKNLVSDHITKGGIKQFAFQSGRPDVAWANTLDGKLIGMTFKVGEDIFGWHRHTMSGKVLSLVSLPRTTDYHRLWAIMERTINGVTRRYWEYMEDPQAIPEEIDFYTDDDSYDDDHDQFLRAMYEAQKYCFHVDSGLTYDGSDSTNSPTTMTPAALTGNDILFTAGAALFKSSDVGREIHKKAVNGLGTGRATIVTYLSATTVRCNITEGFDVLTAMASQGWYFTTDQISNLNHLEDEDVHVIADGGVHEDRTVVSGAIMLSSQASVVHVGLKYRGVIKSMNLEVGGQGGPSQTKPKNVVGVGMIFFQTLGAKVGTDLYHLEEIDWRDADDIGDRPPPLRSESIYKSYADDSEREKHIVIVQDVSLPCNVQLVMPHVLTDNG